ncbi:MAG: HAD hydrolase-like protein [Candidatus Pacebacteria bacterium]|nr:HAD hydrolase-like protein [Candidatus Paceibacterota bacterium]MDD5357383.1 HAD hydrolase-like protein [Candidatus Paceibacterota bacterium]
MKKKKYILFDFDGVIADSSEVSWDLNKKICATITRERWLEVFDGNVHDWDKNTAHWHSPDCKHEIFDWFAEYAPLMQQRVVIFPRVSGVVKKLAEKYTLFIISSSPTYLIEEFMQKNAIREYFADLLGNDVHTSKVEKIRMVFEKYKILPEQCVFVTDTVGDMREAREMDVDSIGASWGYHEHARLTKGNPYRIVHEPEALISAVSDYFAERNQQGE